MHKAIYIIPVLCVMIAVSVILYDRWHTNRIMDKLSDLLDQAIDGSFTDNLFDESKQSALENRLAQYLAASSLSARNIAMEKDKIKTLITDISHQTKTPISNLLLYTELLQELHLDQEASGYVNALHEQEEKLLFLIDTLVKLSRLETGILTFHPQRGDILPMINKTIEQLEAAAKEKGLSLTAEQVNVQAIFDEKWTSEALGNLLDNAVKYTEQGGITVRIKPYEMFVCIEVEDSGIGIPEEEHAKIFTRFYRSQNTANCEGVGIGLYLARQIVTGQGGYMKVSSRVGVGTTFSMYLPR